MGVTTALLTVDEYAQLPEEETMRAELIEGERFGAIWIAYPPERTLVTMHPSGKGHHLHQGHYVEEPDLLPGFRVLVDRFFDGI
jgi:hypothetical protein